MENGPPSLEVGISYKMWMHGAHNVDEDEGRESEDDDNL